MCWLSIYVYIYASLDLNELSAWKTIPLLQRLIKLHVALNYLTILIIQSSPGPDQIHYENLRHLPIETLHILLDIINETWKSDTFPGSWREALIISIPKPGKHNFDPLNYRPIALTSCICKTVERMVNERLVWHLEKNGLLAKQQCGYRSNKSTVDHLVCHETFIKDAFINNQHLVAVFLDLQKAYDATWKYGILNTVFPRGIIVWHYEEITHFYWKLLSHKTFQIHLGTFLSDRIFHQEGVPQGAICQPLYSMLKSMILWSK